jgi:hypothetical protein
MQYNNKNILLDNLDEDIDLKLGERFDKIKNS